MFAEKGVRRKDERTQMMKSFHTYFRVYILTSVCTSYPQLSMSSSSTSAIQTSLPTSSSQMTYKKVHNPILTFDLNSHSKFIMYDSPPNKKQKNNLKASFDDELLSPLTQVFSQPETKDDHTTVNDFTLTNKNEVTNDNINLEDCNPNYKKDNNNNTNDDKKDKYSDSSDTDMKPSSLILTPPYLGYKDRRALQPPEMPFRKPSNIKEASIDFTAICPHCKHMVCDGTTLSTFIGDHLDFSLDDYFDAKESFVNCYFLLKDYECFQSTRFTNPDITYQKENIPACVENAFDEYYEKGSTTFNKNRLKQIKENFEHVIEDDSSK